MHMSMPRTGAAPCADRASNLLLLEQPPWPSVARPYSLRSRRRYSQVLRTLRCRQVEHSVKPVKSPQAGISDLVKTFLHRCSTRRSAWRCQDWLDSLFVDTDEVVDQDTHIEYQDTVRTAGQMPAGVVTGDADCPLRKEMMHDAVTDERVDNVRFFLRPWSRSFRVEVLSPVKAKVITVGTVLAVAQDRPE